MKAEPIVLPEDVDEAIMQAVVEVPCMLRYDPGTDQISIGCAAQDLEDFLERTLEAHD